MDSLVPTSVQTPQGALLVDQQTKRLFQEFDQRDDTSSVIAVRRSVGLEVPDEIEQYIVSLPNPIQAFILNVFDEIDRISSGNQIIRCKKSKLRFEYPDTGRYISLKDVTEDDSDPHIYLDCGARGSTARYVETLTISVWYHENESEFDIEVFDWGGHYLDFSREDLRIIIKDWVEICSQIHDTSGFELPGHY